MLDNGFCLIVTRRESLMWLSFRIQVFKKRFFKFSVLFENYKRTQHFNKLALNKKRGKIPKKLKKNKFKNFSILKIPRNLKQ